MRDVRNLEFRVGSREELLPGFTPDFPYIASRIELDRYVNGIVPWHWHKEVELFYMKSGTLEYYFFVERQESRGWQKKRETLTGLC